MNIYLYVKTHNKTGLKYLGKTIQDPYQYKGSGKRWRNHLKKHGNDVTTEILLITDSKDELRERGIFFSELWDIVSSDKWANLKLEEGDGGNTFQGRKHSKETLEKMRKKSQNRPKITQETKNKMSINRKGKGLGPKPRTKEHQENLTKSLKGHIPWNLGKSGYKCKSQNLICPHCGKSGGSGGLKRWHFDNCKSNPKEKSNTLKKD